MGLFSLNYHNVPGQCVYAKGGLKFRADEEKLYRYFSPILPHISLNDLIGEAVFWSMLPSTLAIWTFPILLYFKGISFALIATLILYLVAEIGHLAFYSKFLNYIIFVLGNNLLALVVYLIWAATLIFSGSMGEVIVLAIWFLFFALGLSQLILLPLLPILTKFFALPPSDQILKNIGWYYAEKFGLDPVKWTMLDEVNNEKQHKENWDFIFLQLESRYKNDYSTMISKIAYSFGRGKVVLILEVMAKALEEAQRNPTRETWEKLKQVLLENPPPKSK